MRRVSRVPIYVLLAVALGGCGEKDCLPLPGADETPPSVSLTVVYRSLDTGQSDTLIVAAADPAVRVDGVNANEVEVRYSAHDPEGLRRVHLGSTLLTTVGVGIESRRFGIEPLTTECPKSELRGVWTAPPGDPGRSVSLGLVAENWAGMRSSTETVTVRLR